mgnify:CR=1 FL=1
MNKIQIYIQREEVIPTSPKKYSTSIKKIKNLGLN